MENCAKKPMIVLVGIETKIFKYLDQFIGKKFQLFPVDHVDDYNSLDASMNIRLFLLDVDKEWLGTHEIMHKIKSNSMFHNIPVIGLALKKHFSKLPLDEKHLYEDFLLLPCGNEDLLTRIEVWTKTYGIMCEDRTVQKTFSLDHI